MSLASVLQEIIVVIEDEWKKLFPPEETVFEDIIALFAKVAPILEEVDAIIAPTLKSAKATAANTTALNILSQVSSVASAVAAVNEAAKKATATPTAPASTMSTDAAGQIASVNTL